MESVVLDTDAATHLQRGSLPAGLEEQVGKATVALTFVTVGELFQGAVHAAWGTRRVAALELFVSRLPIIPFSLAVARTWGDLCGEALRRGRRVPANDAWVAACCITHDLPLLTFNRRHFDELPGLRLVAAG